MNQDQHNQLAEILRLAVEVSLSGKAHVFVHFAGHVNGLSVDVRDAQTDYSIQKPSFIWRTQFYLDTLSPEQLTDKLEAVLAQLQSMFRERVEPLHFEPLDVSPGDLYDDLPSYLKLQAE